MSSNRNWLVFFLVVLTGCTRKTETSGLPRRVGIPAFENLSSDVTLDWVGRAAATVISSQINSPKSIVPVELSSIRDAESAKVSELVHGYYTLSGDELRLTAQLRDSAAQKNEKQITAVGKLSSGVLPLVDSLAKQINPAAHPYVTKSEAAVREMFQAVSAPTQDQSLAHLELAVKADPSFGPAYLSRIQLLLARGDANGAKAALAQASQYSKSFSEIDQAKLGMMQASLEGSRPQRIDALSRLVELGPADLSTLNALATLQVADKNFQGAIKTFRTGLQMEPGNIVLLNSLAYAQAYAGDLKGAFATIEEYRRLAPNDANAYDTLAEIQFFSGRFADAERNFVEANQRNKALVNGQELYRAALSAFLAGNLKGAHERFKEYGAAHAKDPLLPVRQTIWAHQTGDKSAVGQLQKVAAQKETPPEVASVAHAQLAIWLLDSGERDRAREEVMQALKLAVSPGSKNFAAVSAFLAGPKATAAEWKLRAERAAPGQPATQRQVLGYALLLAKEYPEAAAVWKTVYDEGGLDVMGEPKVFLSYAYTKAAMKLEAAALMKTGILPPKGLDPGVPSLLIPYYSSIR